MDPRLERVLFWLVSGVAGWVAVLQLDALTIALRGGEPRLLAFAQWMAVGCGLATGLAAAASGAVAATGQRWLAALCARVSVELPSGSVLVLLAAAVGTLALAQAHAVFSQHPATMALMMAYLPFALGAGAALLVRGFRARGRIVPLGLALCLLSAAAALHFVNAWYYPGLYRPVHHALSGLALSAAVLGAAFALRSASAQLVRRGLAALVLSGLLSWPLAGGFPPRRADALFDGTELHYCASWLDRARDGDGDGLPSPLDCDDTNPAVHPAALERPGNGLDDNCKLGDGVAGLVETRQQASAPPAGLDPWRAAHPQPNVVIVLIDTLRADHVGALGSKRGLTPNLDRLAARSTVFTQARTTSPRTAPALLSLASGRFYGRTLGCRGDSWSTTPTLATRLQGLGYDAVARLVGDNWRSRPAGDHWGRVIQKQTFQDRTGPGVTADALKLLSEMRRPFLLFVHYADPHAPYHAHPGVKPRGTGIAARYGVEVEATDRELGRLLSAIDSDAALRDTIVIVFSDHGENLGERGSRGGHHGVSLYDEDVHVPLVIHVPGTGGRMLDAPVSIADLAPTVLELVGAPALPDTDGRSLAGYVLGAPPKPTWTLSEYYDPDYQLRAVVEGHHKLLLDIGRGTARLFDLRADPGELRDLKAALPERVARMRGMADHWIETRADPTRLAPARCPVGL